MAPGSGPGAAASAGRSAAGFARALATRLRFVAVASRSASATRMSEPMTSPSVAPLGTISHGCWAMTCWASLTMPPQLGLGGLTPRLM